MEAIIKRVFPGMTCTPDILNSEVDQSIMYTANKTNVRV